MKMSRIEAGTRIVLELIDALNRQEIPKMLGCLSPDCLLETATPAPQGATYRGKEAITRYWQTFFAHKDQLHLEIEEIFGLGYRCVVCWRLRWSDKKGEPTILRGADIFKIKEGLICEQLSYVKSALEIN